MNPEMDHVAANYRYIAAYNEVTARVSQRQQSLVFYATLVFGLLAALLASRAFALVRFSSSAAE